MRLSMMVAMVVAAGLLRHSIVAVDLGRPSTPTASTITPTLTLGGFAIDGSVLDGVRAFGPPDVVETSDAGHEWHWYDARGIDRAVLVDDALAIHEILIERPAAVNGQAAPLVQPDELPVLEKPLREAAALLSSRRAASVMESNPAIRAWRVAGALVVTEIAGGDVARIRALDDGAAAQRGYVGGGGAAPAYRAPRFLHVASVGYPERAESLHAHGVVIARVDVDAAGRPARVSVIVSSGNADLDNAEVRSLQLSAFKPALCAGQPCAGVLMDREEYVP